MRRMRLSRCKALARTRPGPAVHSNALTAYFECCVDVQHASSDVEIMSVPANVRGRVFVQTVEFPHTQAAHGWTWSLAVVQCLRCVALSRASVCDRKRACVGS